MNRASTALKIKLQPVPARHAAIIPTGLTKSIGESLPGAVQCIIERLAPEKIILFGSYAYGAPTPDSDVDLLIILETTASAKERYLAVSDLLGSLASYAMYVRYPGDSPTLEEAQEALKIAQIVRRSIRKWFGLR